MMLFFENYHVGINSEVLIDENCEHKLFKNGLMVELSSPNYKSNDELANVSTLLREKGYPCVVSFSGDLNDKFGNMYILLYGAGSFLSLPDIFIKETFVINKVPYTLVCPRYFNPYAVPAKKDNFFRKRTAQLLQSVNKMEACSGVDLPHGFSLNTLKIYPGSPDLKTIHPDFPYQLCGNRLVRFE